jgi:hypothetical protein
LGLDASLAFLHADLAKQASCLADLTRIAYIDTAGAGCVAASVMQNCTFGLIIIIIFIRFVFYPLISFLFLVTYKLDT